MHFPNFSRRYHPAVCKLLQKVFISMIEKLHYELFIRFLKRSNAILYGFLKVVKKFALADTFVRLRIGSDVILASNKQLCRWHAISLFAI